MLHSAKSTIKSKYEEQKMSKKSSKGSRTEILESADAAAALEFGTSVGKPLSEESLIAVVRGLREQCTEELREDGDMYTLLRLRKPNFMNN